MTRSTPPWSPIRPPAAIDAATEATAPAGERIDCCAGSPPTARTNALSCFRAILNALPWPKKSSLLDVYNRPASDSSVLALAPLIRPSRWCTKLNALEQVSTARVKIPGSCGRSEGPLVKGCTGWSLIVFKLCNTSCVEEQKRSTASCANDSSFCAGKRKWIARV